MIPASRSRLAAVALITAGLLAVLGVRLWNVQITAHRAYLALANQDQVRYIVEPPVRGQIFDDTGHPLVDNAASLTVPVSADSGRGARPAEGRAAGPGRQEAASWRDG